VVRIEAASSPAEIHRQDLALALKKRLSAPETFLIVSLLAFGLITCLATPLSAGYDEETHFIRAWEMAHLYLVPNEQLGAQLPFPALYWDLSTVDVIVLLEPVSDPLARSASMPAGTSVPMSTRRCIRFPSCRRRWFSLPRLIMQLPALVIYYACRMADCFPTFCCVAAMRFIPYGKWPRHPHNPPMAVLTSTISVTISTG
jgi:hypothetical protein